VALAVIRSIVEARNEGFDREYRMSDTEGLDLERLKRLNISPEDYIKVKELADERERHVPGIGDPAPDFDLELLTGDGKRSDQRVRLSSLRGKPVLLYFGSYT
jgi:hypothetical protein